MNLSSTFKALGTWIANSSWAGLVGKGMAYLVAFGLLALVGSGRLSAWRSPPGLAVVPVAEASAATPPTPSTVAFAPPAPSDAGTTPTTDTDAGMPPNNDAGAASSGVAPDGKVLLNLATEDDLRRLPGVGPVRAKAILALRARLKRFSRVEDLLKVKGLGRRLLARLRPLVKVD